MDAICSNYAEDQAICDDLGEPKGQCANCGEKWYDHDMTSTEYKSIREKLGLTQAALAARVGMTITEIYNRLKSDQADQAAFPRPNHAMVAAFEAVGVKAKPSNPITTMEIEAMTGVSFRHLSTALASLAGLLAIYGADYRLHRVNLSEGNCPRYGYYIAPVKE